MIWANDNAQSTEFSNKQCPKAPDSIRYSKARWVFSKLSASQTCAVSIAAKAAPDHLKAMPGEMESDTAWQFFSLRILKPPPNPTTPPQRSKSKHPHPPQHTKLYSNIQSLAHLVFVERRSISPPFRVLPVQFLCIVDMMLVAVLCFAAIVACEGQLIRQETCDPGQIPGPAQNTYFVAGECVNEYTGGSLMWTIQNPSTIVRQNFVQSNCVSSASDSQITQPNVSKIGSL